MTSVNGVEMTSGAGRSQSADAALLSSFCSKVSAGGDLTSECMEILSKDSSLQMRINRQGAKLQERAVQEARQKRQELIKKIKEASEDSGFWGGLASVFSGIATAVGVALNFVAFPGAGLLLGSALAAGGSWIAQACYDHKAGLASASKVQVEHFQQEAVEFRDDHICSLRDVVRLEEQMVERIRTLVDSEPDIILHR